MTALKGKEKADLRNQQLKKLIIEWEKQRDILYDEIAFRKGKVSLLEESIKKAYEMVLDVNKEEQQKEQEELRALLEAEKSSKKPPRGAKTPKTKLGKRRKQ